MPEGDIHIHQQADHSENVTMIGYIEKMVQEVKRERACPTAPPPPAHFAGRVDQLAELRQRLATGQQTAITAVQGLGGMGKTTLAKAFAQLATRELGYSAVLWADITRNPDALRWLESWAQYADPGFSLADVKPETPPAALAGQVRSLLTALIAELCPGPVLVVLDDVWPGEGITAARLLIQAAPEGSTLFITTRFEDVARQLRCTVLGVPRLPEPEAIELLGKLVDNPAATPEHFTALAKLLGGHPLALELAAGSVNLCEGAGEIAALLDGYEKGLKDGVPFHELELGDEAGAKEDSLIVTFQHSYDALDPDLQRCFRAMGIFPPDTPWDATLAANVWEVKEGPSTEEDKAAVKPIIKALRVRGLLAPTRLEGYPEGWYEPHPLLRSYARALLIAAGEMVATRDRYEQGVIKIADWGFELPYQEWRGLTPYLPHIHAVGDNLVTRVEVALDDLELLAQPEPVAGTISQSTLSEADHALLNAGSDFAATVYSYVWFRRERGEIGRRWLVMGLACARVLEQIGRESLLTDTLAQWHDQRGQKQDALAYLKVSLAIDQKRGERKGEATTLNNIGGVYDDLGDRQQALHYYEKALPIRREVGDRPGEAITLNNIGGIYDALGNHQQALHYYEEALPILRKIDDRFAEATILGNIGLVHNALGDRQQALRYFEEALPILRKVGDRSGEATTLNNIGMVYHTLGDRQQALRYHEEALPIRREVGDRLGEATTLHNIAGVHFDAGEYDKALEILNQILPVQREVGDRHSEALTLFNMSHLVAREEALPLVELARDIWKAIGSPEIKRAEVRLSELRDKLNNDDSP